MKNVGATTLAILHSRHGRNYICCGLRGLVSFFNTHIGTGEWWHSVSSLSYHLHRIHYSQHRNHHHICCCHLINFNFLFLSDRSLSSIADKKYPVSMLNPPKKWCLLQLFMDGVAHWPYGRGNLAKY